MALSKEIIEDKIEVVGEHKNVQIRIATIIKEDGVEINRSFERRRLVCCFKNNDSWEDICKIVDSTSPYALTGAVFGDDKDAVLKAKQMLEHSAGNFYINDKPTGAVVGQQPFGGSRASGTNDKAGSSLNLLRWTSVRTVKETFNTPEDYRYPFLGEK